VISPSAAKKCLAAIFPLKSLAVHIPALGKTLQSLAIDVQLNRVYRSLKSYVAIPPLVLPVNDKACSDIQTRSEHLANNSNGQSSIRDNK
jgi:hypothetical protein